MEGQIQMMLNVDIKADSRDANIWFVSLWEISRFMIPVEMEGHIQVMLNVDIKTDSRDANIGLCHFGKLPDSGDAKRRYQGRFT